MCEYIDVVMTVALLTLLVAALGFGLWSIGLWSAYKIKFGKLKLCAIDYQLESLSSYKSMFAIYRGELRMRYEHNKQDMLHNTYYKVEVADNVSYLANPTISHDSIADATHHIVSPFSYTKIPPYIYHAKCPSNTVWYDYFIDETNKIRALFTTLSKVCAMPELSDELLGEGLDLPADTK